MNSKDVSAVLREHSNVIMNFFREAHPDSAAPYGIDRKVPLMSTTIDLDID